MQLQCKRCNAAIAAEDVNLANALAKCRACNAIFSFAADVGLAEGGSAKPPVREKVPLPPSLQIQEGIGRLTLTRKWFTPAILFLAFFCVIWDGFLVVWYGMAIFGASKMGAMSIVMLLFPLLHVAVGVGLTYFTIASFFNSTVIEVARGSLKVTHGPLPWFGQVDLKVSDLSQIFCEEVRSNSRRSGTSFSYRVNAVLASGNKTRIVDALTDADQALYIEQAIETHLGIEDRRIPGELAH